MERSAAWAMIGAMTVSGFIGLFVKESGVDPLTLVFYRCLIGGLVLFILSYWLSQPVPMSWRERLINNAAGLALIVNWWCLFASFNYLPVSYATLLYNLQPFMLLMLSSLAIPLLVDTILIWPFWVLFGASAGGLFTLSLILIGERYRDDALVRANAHVAQLWGIGCLLGPLAAGAGSKWVSGQALPLLMAAGAFGLVLLSRRERAFGAQPVAV